MRNTAIVLAVAAAFAAAPVFAQDTTPPGTDNGFFIDGGIGHSYFGSGSNSGNDTGYAISGGYRWALAPNFAVGPEVGYNDLGNIRLRNVFNTNPVVSSGRASLHGWTIGGNAKYNFTPNWYVSARLGLYAWNGRGTTSDITLNPTDLHRNSDGYYGGVGVGYDFNRSFGVGVGYDYYRADKGGLNLSTGLLAAQAEVRF